jgi:ArsR family transcriptional regulator
MDHIELATMCNAMGDPTRAHIIQLLLGCCCSLAVGEDGGVAPVVGMTAGEVCCHVTGVEKITSTISFHLDKLRQAGLVDVQRQGKHMVCTVNREAIGRLAEFFGEASKGGKCCGELNDGNE